MRTSRRIPELPDTQVGRDYYVRFVCPHCFRSKWVLKRGLALTLQEVLNTFWEFQCPVHGPLREKPLEASYFVPAWLPLPGKVPPGFDTNATPGSAWPTFQTIRIKVNALTKTLILVNPVAGGGRAKLVQPGLAEYLLRQGLRADFLEPENAEDLRRCAAEAAAAGYGRIVAMGGDGTFQQVVKGTLGTGTVLGFFPAGGGNDVAEALGIPQDPIAAAHAFLHSQPRRMDVLRARFAFGKTSLYVGGGGLGLDAEAAGLANGRFRRLPGAARYVAGALWALAAFQPFHVEVEMDGAPLPTRGDPLIFAAVANTPTYGAGVKIAPTAEIDDGQLDLVLLAKLPWTRLLELIPVLLRTGDVRSPEIQRFRARRVRLKADRPALFHGDGEVLGEAPVDIENLPGAIRVIAPARR